jgi:malate dehydrogenase (oxaloacetate-decarboxylating)
VLSAIQVTGVALEEQRFVVFGFGSAGLGIIDLLVKFLQDKGLTPEDVRKRCYAIDRDGLITEKTQGLRPEQMIYARKEEEVTTWRGPNGEIVLLDVLRNAKPTVLIGVSGQGGAFTEQAVREMAKHTARPVIFPLSNPTSRSEAVPQDLMDWTEGRALIGTGSPFEPVSVGGKRVAVSQTNNSYIFPGLALGIVASRARRVTDPMIQAAAEELVNSGISNAPGVCVLNTLPGVDLVAVTKDLLSKGATLESIRKSLALVCYSLPDVFAYSPAPPDAPNDLSSNFGGFASPAW